MLGHIRKRIQDRRQISFETGRFPTIRTPSPSSSPLTTPTKDLPPSTFAWPSLNPPSEDLNKADENENDYETPVQKAIPMQRQCPPDISELKHAKVAPGGPKQKKGHGHPTKPINRSRPKLQRRRSTRIANNMEIQRNSETRDNAIEK